MCRKNSRRAKRNTIAKIAIAARCAAMSAAICVAGSASVETPLQRGNNPKSPFERGLGRAA
ncbi:MAG: hypothetical protein BWK80_33210 [Desulfobacteraceae bacterium IS3]|nr:MAG: hypothetical protein BWK80_33210 [Desulfobacteraceae bacterium IS3]